MARAFNYTRVVSYKTELPPRSRARVIEAAVSRLSNSVLDCMLDGTTLLVDLSPKAGEASRQRVLRNVVAKLRSLGAGPLQEFEQFDRVETYLIVTNGPDFLPKIGPLEKELDDVRGVAATLVVPGEDDNYRVFVDVEASMRSRERRRTVERVLDALATHDGLVETDKSRILRGVSF